MIRFQTVDAQDVVRSAATNLEGSDRGIGIRLEIPNHLKADMKSLQILSFDLKSMHPAARWHVLFDYNAMCIVLDFCLGEGKLWRRITAKQARSKPKNTERGAGRFHVQDDELDSTLSGQDAKKLARLDGVTNCANFIGQIDGMDNSVMDEIESDMDDKYTVKEITVTNTNVWLLCPEINSMIDCLNEMDN